MTFPSLMIPLGIFILGTIAGSFLSVLVTRLPVMLTNSDPDCTLWSPPSSCTNCNRVLPPLSLIPLVSFLIQGGKCKFCSARIPLLYPLLELVAGMIAVAAWLWIPDTISAIVSMTAGWLLLALMVIDWRKHLLPDVLVYPLLWLGLVVNIEGSYVSASQAIWGAIVGYVFLWIVRYFYNRMTAREGLGLGDCKLFAACGAWVGWFQLPIILILACSVSAAIVLAVYRTAKQPFKVPFGPGLCVALALTLAYLYIYL